MSVESKALRPCNTAPDTPPHCDSPQAPAVTPGLPHSDPITAISLAELLKDVVKAVQATANTSKANNPHSTESEAVDLSCAPGFKTVDEVYKAYRYTIVESPSDEVENLDHYVFIGTPDRDTKETTYYTDIKSESLRKVLRTVLQGVDVISLDEAELSIEQHLVCHFLPELELEHLQLLVDYIKNTHEATAQHLGALLQSGQITYDLLWALFKPNALKIECRYLNFNGTDFGEASTKVKIPKFRGVKANLLECGKKFIRLIGTYHCYWKEIGFPVDSRIIVDAAFFRIINPNYARPKVDKEDDVGLIPLLNLLYPTQPLPKRVRSTGLEPNNLTKDNLLIYSPTKEVIMALTEARTNLANGFKFNNFVAGKGRGLVVLLHGSLGLGKTLTAKAVAKYLKQPLYLKVILLLDKADVYLKRRSSHDLSRNSLVTIFLRKLEYLKGILFLTINRVSKFNEAILSRGHFLSRSRTSYRAPHIHDEELERLVSSKLNRRQIKNTVSTAHALATKGECRIWFTHLSKALTISEKFICEFNGAEHVTSLYG
ncbi:P-loop containing nucleoside triphosphate hydrolase protein [Cenococcum geophilum]